MSWLTTCPKCQTTFRIGFRQLDAHQGMVRCGKCANVFNAREHLKSAAGDLPPPPPAHEPPAAPAETFVPAESSVPVAPPEPPAQNETPVAPTLEETPPPEHEDALSIFEAAIAANSPVHEPAETASAEQAVEEGEETGQAAPLAAEEAPQETPAATEAEAPAEEGIAPPEKPKRRLGWLWALGSVLMLALFAVQGLYLFRTPLAVSYPAMKPMLVNLCGALNCKVALPRTQDGEILGIVGSDLQTDPVNPSVLTLNAVLRNRASHPYEYPLLEVTLTDAADRPVLQRVLQPAEYLPNGANPAAGVPPKSETNIKLNLGVTDVAPVGFRLYLFYPLP